MKAPRRWTLHTAWGNRYFDEDPVLYHALQGQIQTRTWSQRWSFWRWQLSWRLMDWAIWHLPFPDRYVPQSLDHWLRHPLREQTADWYIGWNGWQAIHDDTTVEGFYWAWPRRDHDNHGRIGFVVRGSDCAYEQYEKGDNWGTRLPPTTNMLTLEQIPSRELTFRGLECLRLEAREQIFVLIGLAKFKLG